MAVFFWLIVAVGVIAYATNKILTYVEPTAPVNPPGASLTDPTARVILAYNNSHSPAIFIPDPAKGVIVHKITIAQANLISSVVQQVCAKNNYPISYLLACLGVESVLDPLCQNGNLGIGESNAGQPENLGGYDMGIAQLKLKELIGQSGIPTLAAAEYCALTVALAVPYHISLMLGKIEAAKAILANPSSAPDPRMKDPYMLATWMYNEGNEGAMAAYNAGQFPNHCASVLSDWQYFDRCLGIKTVPADLVS